MYPRVVLLTLMPPISEIMILLFRIFINQFVILPSPSLWSPHREEKLYGSNGVKALSTDLMWGCCGKHSFSSLVFSLMCRPISPSNGFIKNEERFPWKKLKSMHFYNSFRWPSNLQLPFPLLIMIVRFIYLWQKQMLRHR